MGLESMLRVGEDEDSNAICEYRSGFVDPEKLRPQEASSLRT